MIIAARNYRGVLHVTLVSLRELLRMHVVVRVVLHLGGAVVAHCNLRPGMVSLLATSHIELCKLLARVLLATPAIAGDFDLDYERQVNKRSCQTLC